MLMSSRRGMFSTLMHTLLISHLLDKMDPLQWICVMFRVITTFCTCWRLRVVLNWVAANRKYVVSFIHVLIHSRHFPTNSHYKLYV